MIQTQIMQKREEGSGGGNSLLPKMISSPCLKNGHLSVLDILLDDNDMVNLMKCSSKLYNFEYPLYYTKHYYSISYS